MKWSTIIHEPNVWILMIGGVIFTLIVNSFVNKFINNKNKIVSIDVIQS